MSGGRFEYVQYRFSDVADQIRQYREREQKNTEEPLPDDIAAKFDEAAKAIDIVSRMVQRIDWLLSGDDGFESFRDRWADEVETLQKSEP